jgi:hypothetical protein
MRLSPLPSLSSLLITAAVFGMLGGIVPASMQAQGTEWVITTPTGDRRADPEKLTIRTEYITLDDRDPAVEIAVADILEVSVFRPTTFWKGARKGAHIGLVIGAAGGLLVEGVLASSSAERIHIGDVAMFVGVGAGVFGILGALIGGTVESIASDETHEMRGMSDTERRMMLIELQQEVRRGD